MLSKIVPVHAVKDSVIPFTCAFDVLACGIRVDVEADAGIEGSSESDFVDGDANSHAWGMVGVLSGLGCCWMVSILCS